MQSRKEIEKDIEQRLINHKSAIKRMRAQADEVSDEARVVILKKIEELNEMMSYAESKLEQLQGSNDDTWEESKASVEEYWDSLGRELKAYDPDTNKTS